jgi:serine/threonine protein kinase
LKITSGKYNPIGGNYSEELKNLVKAMLSLQAHDRPSAHSILQMEFMRKKMGEVLENSLRRYEESIQMPILEKQRTSLSNQRLLSQKRSFSSLSNSSMLTPKNTNTLNNTKIVEMKQSYPILVEEVKQLKK